MRKKKYFLVLDQLNFYFHMEKLWNQLLPAAIHKNELEMYEFVKASQTVPLISVHLTLYNLYLKDVYISEYTKNKSKLLSGSNRNWLLIKQMKTYLKILGS